MPPKIDPNEIKYIRVKVFGGEPGPASTLAPKLGPLGLNAKKIGEDIIKEGTKMKGIRCMIQLKVQNRAAEISIVPTSSALLIAELNEPVRDRKKVKNIKHSGNLSMEQVKKVAKLIESKSLAKSFTGTVKQVLGTCCSLGCTVENENPRNLLSKIDSKELVVE